MMPPRGAGAVEEFDFVRFGGPTRPIEPHVSVNGPNIQIVGNNPDRVMLILTNNGPDVLYWSTRNNAAFPSVQQLGAGLQEVFQVQNDGALCASQIIGTTSLALCEVNILELVRTHAV
jgi:hypothetical protein